MFKFLRKYNKWILAIGGTLLMIVFLIPQAIQTLSQRAALGGAVWATVGEDGTEVSAEVRRQCESELDVLDRLRRVDPTLLITDRPEHWYLLVREADQAGLLGGRARDLVAPDRMALYASVVGQSSLVDSALSKRIAIQRMLLMYQDAPKLSDNRLRREAARRFHQVDARMLVVEAKDREDAPDPSEEEVLAQYEKYRDVAPGPPVDGEGPGFGYRLPDRLKIEWLRIPTASIRELVVGSGAIDGVALFKHWQRYQEERNFPPVETGVPAPDEVREDLIKDLVEKKRDEIRKFASDQLLAATRRLRLRDGYRVVPDDWAKERVDFRALARAVQKEFPGLDLPEYGAIGDHWIAVDEVGEIEAIAGAQSDKFGPRPVGITALVGAAREFGGNPTILVQEGISSPALEDAEDQSLVFFRITATDPSRPPHDVGEVRDAVVRDLKRQADFDQLAARAESIEADARRDGLLEVAMELDTEVHPSTAIHIDNQNLLAFSIQQGFDLTRSSALPVLGQDVPTVERIIDRSLEITRDRPLVDVPASERIFALPVPDRMALLVVELRDETPLTRDRFAQLVGLGIRSMIINEELLATDPPVNTVFTYDALAKRHHFVIKRRVDEDETEDATAAAKEG